MTYQPHQSEDATLKPVAAEPDLLLTFSLAYLDGVMEGEPAEVRRHWERVRAAVCGVDLPAPAQPVGWLDSFGELHKRREDAWDGDPDSTPPRPVYEQPAAGVALPAEPNKNGGA
jgi:hypothetical protein